VEFPLFFLLPHSPYGPVSGFQLDEGPKIGSFRLPLPFLMFFVGAHLQTLLLSLESTFCDS
jgi:hypothetical protein